MIQWDVAKLGKIPRHVAVILDQRKMRREYDADEIVRRATDISTWCACAGVSMVTVYEPNGCPVYGIASDYLGLLKKDVKTIQRNVQKMTTLYFQKSTPCTIDVRTPQSALLTNGSTPHAPSRSTKTSLLILDLEILVISSEDSRLPIVDLARTLGDMTKQEKLFPEDISIDLIHQNLTGSLNIT